MIASHIKKKTIVIYESTVYPGATEDVCVPILEKISRLKLNSDFFVGYSPERINPGDKYKKVIDIKKITSASSPKALNIVDKLYKSIIRAGTYRASSIKIAEAAKVIENSQRDLNIAFMNEISKIFNRAKINTNEVIEAASSKWNFIRYSPGLVGGHCISVDPYYLTNKAEALGYYPDLILSARRVNESMPSFIASTFSKIYLTRNRIKSNRNILIFGVSFKENCADIRNSKVFDLIKSFEENGFNPEVVDPIASISDIFKQEGIKIYRKPLKLKYAGVVLAVSHEEFVKKPVEYFKNFLIKDGLFFDLKSVYKKEFSDFQL
jgi:UDP-N-acetyl-D-galactosamine dehydrogenase